jgi:hypothetical protein
MSELWKEWLTGGVANAFTSAILNPMDIVKTRLQINQDSIPSKYSARLSRTFKILYSEGGLIGVMYLLFSCIIF